MKNINYILAVLFLLSTAPVCMEMENEALKSYLLECNQHSQRAVAIIGCGKCCSEDFFDEITYMQQHEHYGHNFYIDQNEKVKPDLVMNFLEITPNIIPDQIFDTVYFEYMTNFLKTNPQAFFDAAYRILKPGGIVAFDGEVWDNPEAWRMVSLIKALQDAGFVDIREPVSNTFNSRRQENLILATRPYKENPLLRRSGFQ